MAQDDKTRANALIDQYSDAGGLNVEALCDRLSQIVMTWTFTVFEVFEIFTERQFTQADHERMASSLIGRINPANLIQLAQSSHGKILLKRIQYIMNCEANSSQPTCQLISTAVKRAKDSEGNPYYTIDADIILEADAIAVLEKIAPLYFAKIGKKFNVNSGTRDAYRQADAMYNVYMSGGKTLPLYKNRKAANELIAIIEKGESKTVTIQKMTDLIQKYFNDGILMSPHQRAGAIDISIRGYVGVPPMTTDQRKIMMEIATKITGFAALLENDPPHIHIKFK